MSRITATLDALRARGRVALVPFVTAGDPDLETTAEVVRAAVAAGADMIELGVPFSDPMADGPILQRSAQRALRAGTSLARVLGLVGELRRDVSVPMILFGYYNPFFRYGVDAIARDAAAVGADAFLCVDLPHEESGELREAAAGVDLDVIALIAPTTPLARVRRIASAATGFLYFVSVLGVTGGRDALPPELPAMVARARGVTALPIGVGFGVQRPEQAAWVAGFADAVIVGSAIGRILEEAPAANVAATVGGFVRELRAAMSAPR